MSSDKKLLKRKRRAKAKKKEYNFIKNEVGKSTQESRSVYKELRKRGKMGGRAGSVLKSIKKYNEVVQGEQYKTGD